MKRFWRIIFITLGILAGVGLTSLLLGSLSGGVAQVFTMIGQKARDRGARYCAQEVGSDGDEMLRYLEEEMADSGLPVVREPHYEDPDVAGTAEVKNILLEAGRCELLIREAEGDRYGISADGIHALQYYVEDGTFIIRACHDGGSNTDNGKLTLYVPGTGAVNEIEVEFGAGSLQAENVHAEYFSLMSDAGDISFQGLQADLVEIRTGLGRVEISEGEVTDLVIDAGMGSVFYEGIIRGDVEAACAMGTIHLAIEGNQYDFNYETECAAGSIIIGETERDGILYVGEHMFNNRAEKEMELACAMGAIHVEFYERGGKDHE